MSLQNLRSWPSNRWNQSTKQIHGLGLGWSSTSCSPTARSSDALLENLCERLKGQPSHPIDTVCHLKFGTPKNPLKEFLYIYYKWRQCRFFWQRFHNVMPWCPKNEAIMSSINAWKPSPAVCRVRLGVFFVGFERCSKHFKASKKT